MGDFSNSETELKGDFCPVVQLGPLKVDVLSFYTMDFLKTVDDPSLHDDFPTTRVYKT